MTEQGYQSKIIKAIEAIGGVAINGNFTTAGTADLICGYPWTIMTKQGYDFKPRVILLHLHIEVKTPFDYDRVFRSIYEEDGYYHFKDDIKSLKKHEYLQITKLNKLRKLGGLGLIAHSFEQVKEYVDGNS